MEAKYIEYLCPTQGIIAFCVYVQSDLALGLIPDMQPTASQLSSPRFPHSTHFCFPHLYDNALSVVFVSLSLAYFCSVFELLSIFVVLFPFSFID